MKLRTVVRIALVTSHLDYQRLRIRNVRPDDDDEAPPETADDSTPTDPGAAPSTTG